MSRKTGLTLCILLASLLPGCGTDTRTASATAALPQGAAVSTPAESSSPPEKARASAETVSTPPADAESGIEVVALRLSAAGNMLDLRYRIKDPVRAAAFLDRHADRYLIAQATGAQLRVPSSPKVGALRQAPQNPDPQRVCFTLFANPGRQVRSGDRVTLAVGACRIPDLVVE
jgi:hypothetical protein